MLPTHHIKITLVTSQIERVRALICLVTLTPAMLDIEIEAIPIKVKYCNTLDKDTYFTYAAGT